MDVAERICSRILIIDRGREVVSGTLTDVKTRFGRNAVSVEFDGELDMPVLGRLVRSVNRFPRYVEMELADGVAAQAVLEALVKTVAVRRFEVLSPSLHGIFVAMVGKAAPAADRRGGR
jgi:ABC-2 type transport system ATP-binding protein